MEKGYIFPTKGYVFPIFPVIIQVEPTNHCNFNCPHCPRQMMTYPKGYMKFSTFKKIVDEASEKRELMPVEIKLFYLGEPLLHPQLKKMCEYLTEKQVPFGVTTNGSLLNYDNITFLLQNARQLGVSIDGYNTETYKQLRGGDYEKTTANLRRLCSLKKRGNSKTTIRLTTVIPDNDAQASMWLTEILKQWYGYNLIVGPLERHLYQNTSWLGEPSKLTPIQRSYICEDGLTSLVIRWNGDVQYCCADINCEGKLGNVNTQTLQEIWISKQMWQLRKQITSKNYINPVCSRCSVDTSLKHNIKLSMPAEYQKMLG